MSPRFDSRFARVVRGAASGVLLGRLFLDCGQPAWRHRWTSTGKRRRARKNGLVVNSLMLRSFEETAQSVVKKRSSCN